MWFAGPVERVEVHLTIGDTLQRGGPDIAAGSSIFTMWRAKPPLPPAND